MLDKKDTTLIKLDCKSKDKVYDMLFGKADACLKNAKTVALLYLGSPYYMTRALEEYNIEEVNIFTTKDFKFIYEPFENAERVKIWYVDNVKDTFKECDMKFDCIIMNPPYDGQLHLKIFEEASKHLSKDGICVSLSPTPWLAKFNVNRPMAKYRKVFNGKIKHIEVIEHATANAMFDTGNAIEELGIYVVKNDDSAPIDLMKYGFNNDAEKSLYDKINMMNPKAGVITYNKAALDIRYGRVSAKTAYCNKGSTNIDIRKPFDVPIYTWHGGKTCKEAVLMLKSKKKVSMVLYFNSQVEHDNFINSLDTTFMNWYYQMFVVPGDCKIINYMFRMVDYSQPWTDERFYNFFNITSAEQKVIEETMAKYK